MLLPLFLLFSDAKVRRFLWETMEFVVFLSRSMRLAATYATKPQNRAKICRKRVKKGYAVVEIYVFVNLWRDKTNKFKFLK